MTRRDVYVASIGFNVAGALIGALAHSLLLVAWSVGMVAYAAYYMGD